MSACSTSPTPAPTSPAVAPPAAKPTVAGAPTAVTTQPAAPAKPLATELRIGTSSLNDTPDPHGTLSVSGFTAARPIFDTLVTFDGRSGKIVPQLASEWKRIDNLTVEFKLRDDVKFSNGEDFTAETVKFNVDRIMKATEPLYVNTKSRMGPLVKWCSVSWPWASWPVSTPVAATTSSFATFKSTL
jgi:peptide/nickel transport system substrate-binding protein